MNQRFPSREQLRNLLRRSVGSGTKWTLQSLVTALSPNVVLNFDATRYAKKDPLTSYPPSKPVPKWFSRFADAFNEEKARVSPETSTGAQLLLNNVTRGFIDGSRSQRSVHSMAAMAVSNVA